MRPVLCLYAFAAVGGAALPAAAETPCTAPAPASGAAFSGPVLQVIDGGRLCVATGPTPAEWIEVRPLDLPAAAQPSQGRAVLMAATFSRRLDCVAGRKAGHAVSAACTVAGAPLAGAVKAAAAQPGSADWR